MARDLKPEYIIQCRDSLWLARCYSSAGEGGSAHPLVLYCLEHKFTFSSSEKILILFYAEAATGRHLLHKPTLRETEVRTPKNIEKMRQGALEKGTEPILQTNYIFPPPQLSPPLSLHPLYSGSLSDWTVNLVSVEVKGHYLCCPERWSFYLVYSGK